MNVRELFKSLFKSDPEWKPRYIKKVKPSVPKGGFKKRGIGYTRKSKEKPKVRRKMARESRRINRK